MKAPLFDSLRYLYENGFRMVDLFFVISGLVMYLRYESEVRQGSVSAVRYVGARIARLWPLATLTLIVCAVLTWIHHVTYGSFLFYEQNDIVAFVLNLGFMQAGFFSNVGLSFNGPSWTIAVEFWIYLLLFVVLRRFRRPTVVVVPVALAATALLVNQSQPLLSLWYRGLAGFFVGVSLSVVRSCILARLARPRRLARFLISLGTAAFVLVLLQMYMPNIDVVTGFSDDSRLYLWHMAAVFMPVVLGLSLLKNPDNRWSRRVMTWLGNMSYGVYMWHVPVQMALILFVRRLNLEDQIFNASFLMTFVLIVVLVATIGFHTVEVPSRRRILAWVSRLQMTSTGRQ
jgi:peptidoglycan/LPS O-acetylase OafA/YrhL